MATYMESSQRQDKGWTRVVCDSMPFIYLIVASLLVGFTYNNVVISNPWILIAFLAFTAFTLVVFSVLAHWLNCCEDSLLYGYRQPERNGKGSHHLYSYRATTPCSEGSLSHGLAVRIEESKHGHPSLSHYQENLSHAHHHHSDDGTEGYGATPCSEGSLHHGLAVRIEESKHGHPSLSHYQENLSHAHHHHSDDGTEGCVATPCPEDSPHHGLADQHTSWRKLKMMIAGKWSDFKDWVGHHGNEGEEEKGPWRTVEKRTYWSEAEVREPMSGQKSWTKDQAGPIFDPDHCDYEILITAIICAVGTVAGKTSSFRFSFTLIIWIK